MMDTQLDPSSCVIARTRLKLPSGDLLTDGDPIGPYFENNKKHRWCTEAWISDALRAGHLREGMEVPAPKAKTDKEFKAAEKKVKAADAKKAKAKTDKEFKAAEKKAADKKTKLPPPTD